MLKIKEKKLRKIVALKVTQKLLILFEKVTSFFLNSERCLSIYAQTFFRIGFHALKLLDPNMKTL